MNVTQPIDFKGIKKIYHFSRFDFQDASELNLFVPLARVNHRFHHKQLIRGEFIIMEMYVQPEIQRARLHPNVCPIESGNEYGFSTQLKATFDKDTHALWSHWTAEPRPCFNAGLLADLRSLYDFIGDTQCVIECQGESTPLEYVVMASNMPGVFNLGGDLELFKQLIANKDRAGLLRYGRACIDVLHLNYNSYDLPLTNIALVQGECLGGGFEAALSNDVIIAEKGARFGFPEVLFNLFPGMGAYSFLDRKIGRKGAEELITSGRIHSAQEMLDLGVIDVVAEDGAGESTVHQYIRRRARSRNGLAALASVRRRVHAITFEELLDVVQIWVDAALRLTSRDLKLMQRLVSRQNGLEAAQVH